MFNTTQLSLLGKTHQKELHKDQRNSPPDCFYELHVDSKQQSWTRRIEADVSEALIDAIKSTVRNAVETGRPFKVPGHSDLKIQIKVYDDSFRVGLITQVAGDDYEVVTFGIAVHDDAGSALWRELHQMPGLLDLLGNPAPSTPEAPKNPWILRRTSLTLSQLENVWKSPMTELGRAIAHALADLYIDLDTKKFSFQPCKNQASYWISFDKTNPLASHDTDGAYFNANIMIEPNFTVQHKKITTAELKQYKTGKIRFSLFYRERIIFLLGKIGTLPWLRAPFNMSLYGPTLSGITPSWCPGEEISITVPIGHSGHEYLRRESLFDKRFSETLVLLMRLQTHQPITPEEYRDAVIELGQRYSTEEMLEKALVSCVAH